MKVEPTQEHHWLQKLVGEWTYEHECPEGPDKPAKKVTGSETVRSFGGVWVVCEGKGEMPDGGLATTLMTLGYDPQKRRFVGTWIGSMMTYMWVYAGELDASQRLLPLHTEGPDFVTEGKTAKYKDVIEFIDNDHRTLTSHALGQDGKWREIMKAHYRRRK